MPDSPFWDFPFLEEELAQERVRVCTRTLLAFAKARGLALPLDAEQRLAQLDADTLEALIEQAFTVPDQAAAALLAATRPSGH
jgi:hypothetical protein